MSAHLNALLWFVAILALIPLVLWLLKRSPVGASASAGQVMRQVAALPLSTQQRLVAVEVGSGADRQWLVLGVTPQQITTLHTMPPQTELAVAPPTPNAAFASLLQRMRSGDANDASR